MSIYLAEVTAARIRAEANAVGDVLKSIDAFTKSEDVEYRSRVNREPHNYQELSEDFFRWIVRPDNLMTPFLSKDKFGCRLVFLAEPVFAKYFETQLSNQPLGKVISATLGILDIRFRNMVVLALESDTAMGKGYTVLRAWTNFTSPTNIQTIQVDSI